MSDSSSSSGLSRNAKRKQTRKENARIAQEAAAAEEAAAAKHSGEWYVRHLAEKERLSKLSPFQRIKAEPRFVSLVTLSELERMWGIYVLLDFENAMHDFPHDFDMMEFHTKLLAMLKRKFVGKPLMILGVYGRGSFTAFSQKNVRKLNDFCNQTLYDIDDFPERLSHCNVCGKVATPGILPKMSDEEKANKVYYGRASDRACDLISQDMSSYPTRVGYRRGSRCNVLVITGDRDLGSAMRTLKKRNVAVMLAFTGGFTTRYLRKSATDTLVMNFQEEFFRA